MGVFLSIRHHYLYSSSFARSKLIIFRNSTMVPLKLERNLEFN